LTFVTNAIGFMLAMTGTMAGAQGPVHTVFGVTELTVPAQRLPADCALPDAPVIRIGDNKMQSGLWAGLPITSNPWIGSDRAIVAAIVERMDRPTLVPDAPLTPRDAARFRLQLADGVDEAYAAVYRRCAAARHRLREAPRRRDRTRGRRVGRWRRVRTSRPRASEALHQAVILKVVLVVAAIFVLLAVVGVFVIRGLRKFVRAAWPHS